MAKPSHKQSYSDRQYLFKTYAAANDMTGGYGESDDMEALLKDPTMTTATRCCVRQIRHWFNAGPDMSELHTRHGHKYCHGMGGQEFVEHICETDRRVAEIRDRYC